VRPGGLPDAAVFDPDSGAWEVCARDQDGARHGECLRFRADGSLACRLTFVAGVEEGPFTLYHPDGGVAREGRHAAGRVDGLVIAYASAGADAEPLRACCVPDQAARMNARYRRGELVLEAFYDAGGRPILSDGGPWPPRPPGVPEGAEHDEAGGRWVLGTGEVERVWSSAGVLLEETELDGARRARAIRSYDDSGTLLEACGFDGEGRRHGAFERRLPHGAESPYADRRIRGERGQLEHGQAVGTWSFLDAAGAPIRSVDRGLAFDDGRLGESPAFADAINRPWWSAARALAAERRVREALAAAARAAAADRDGGGLAAFVAEHVVALGPALEAERGAALVDSPSASVATALEALIAGADPAAALRALAAVAPATGRAALDFVEASLLLAPERAMTHMTRALLRLDRGDLGGAVADAAVVERESPSAAASLRGYAEAVFRRFEFEPARAALSDDGDGGDDGDDAAPPDQLALAHDLPSIRRAASVYITRLARARDALGAIAGGTASWLPADLLPQLPDRSVTLGADEELATEGRAVPALLICAHADWSALAWLCWSVGLDRVALPEALNPPPATRLAAAMRMIVAGCWRVHTLPPHLAEVVASELMAVRAMFIWLASPDALSPFERDLLES
jgi:hypothetical protein